MSVDKLSKRYAKALFDEALSSGQLEAVQEDMELLHQTIKASRELKLFLLSPIITQDKKISVIKAVFGGKVSSITEQLLSLLIANGREGYADAIAGSFTKMYNKHKNITHVRVTTAIAMDHEKEQLVRTAIIKKLGETELVIHPHVKPDIIGGFIIDLGDAVYDASVRSKLSTIANELIYN